MKLNRLLIFTLLAVMLLVSGCGGQTQTPATTVAPVSPTEVVEQPTKAPPTAVPPTEVPSPEPTALPKILRIANTASFTTWDPVKSFSTEAAYMANMYEQLLRINPPDSAERFTPLLAESWESSEDGLTWTFHLRQGVTFHDGETMNANAVKLSIEAAKDHGGASFIWAPLDSIETPDDYTVVFNLSYAAPVDLIASSLYGSWIISPKALEAVAADETYYETGKEAGTGPYMIDSYTPDQEVVFKKFDNYWGGWQANNYDIVLCQIVPEATTQQQLLEGGEVDLASLIPTENLDSFKSNPDYTVYELPSFFNYVGFFNTLRPPLDNPLVRQALSYAIPYQDIIDISVSGLGTQSRGPVPQGVWPWSDQVMQYTYDLNTARDLLKQAGYENGGFSLRLTHASENAAETLFAPLIKDSFAQIGVDVSIEPMLFNQQWELAKSDPANAQDMFLLLYWPTYSDAGSDNLWSMFYYTQAPFFNLSYWDNQDYNDLLDQAIATTVTDPTTSQQLYIDAMNLLVDQTPGVFLFDTKAAYVIPNRIAGFQYNLNYPFTPFWFYQLTPAQ
ncbi:MAG: ABC transporter substrate-binding protein [Anaerolineales bacterium]